VKGGRRPSPLSGDEEETPFSEQRKEEKRNKKKSEKLKRRGGDDKREDPGETSGHSQTRSIEPCRKDLQREKQKTGRDPEELDHHTLLLSGIKIGGGRRLWEAFCIIMATRVSISSLFTGTGHSFGMGME